MNHGKKAAGDQRRMPLFDAILEYNRMAPAYFCVPGHRFERGINEVWKAAAGDGIFRFDLTETPMTDDLHNASGAIKEAEELAAELFGADETHFLINGTTCGNQIMVMTAAVSGQKIAVPRNAHKSIVMGLIMGGAEPVYIMPELHAESGLHGGVTPKAVADVFERHPDCRAVLVVSPTYFGLCSDLAGIAEICHAHGALLLVDEAHGAHYRFSDRLPAGAMEQGADLCSQSIHKVAGALTQSSMLHIKKGLVDIDRVRANLHLVQSTSPSYVLMTSLDAARQDLALNGAAMAETALELADYARKELAETEGIGCLGRELIGSAGIVDMDSTRLTFSAAELGLTGFELKELLFNEYGCDTELADYRNVLAIVTFANIQEDVKRLTAALRGISDRHSKDVKDRKEREARLAALSALPEFPPLPERAVQPREAYFADKKRIPWSEAKGKAAGELVAPYPPGIPVVYPGEIVSEEIWTFLEHYRREGRHFHGPSDPELNTFLTI